MKPILTLLLISFCLGVSAQSEKVPEGKEINDTEPLNLSWVVAEFTVEAVESEWVLLNPVKAPLLPKTMKVGHGGFHLEKDKRIRATIRNGIISDIE